MNWYKKLLSQVTKEEMDGVSAPMDTPGKQWVYSIERAMSMAASPDGPFRMESTYVDRNGKEICKFRAQNNLSFYITTAFNPQTYQVDVSVMADKQMLDFDRFASSPEQIPQAAQRVSQFVASAIQKYHTDNRFNRMKYE